MLSPTAYVSLHVPAKVITLIEQKEGSTFDSKKISQKFLGQLV